MAAVLGLLIVLMVVVAIPILCRIAIRRMAASKGLRDWLHAYGPRFRFLERDEPDDGTE
jgi:hypothetical protein